MKSRTSQNRLRQQLLVAAFLVGLNSCDSSTAPTWIGGVSVVARNERIELQNRTTSPVFTMVLGRKAAELTYWFPCVDSIQCPPVAPRATRVEPYPQGLHGVAEREALVYWWHAMLGPDGLMHADSVRGGIVRL